MSYSLVSNLSFITQIYYIDIRYATHPKNAVMSMLRVISRHEEEEMGEARGGL